MIEPANANGILPLGFGWWGLGLEARIAGGPFRFCPPGHYGVCLLEHAARRADAWLPIPDFSTPPSAPAVEDTLKKVLKALLDGRQVWIGCAGGYGRTGLVMALLAKIAGAADPVAHVRATYNRIAVETEAQARYVDAFPVQRLRWWLLLQATRARFRRLEAKPAT